MARFRDLKLQLAMVDEVQRRRGSYAWVSSVRERYEALRPVMSWAEVEHNDSEHAEELEELLAELPIEDDELQRIKSLTLDGDRDLYQWVYPDWWKSGDHFAIHDLTGIEQCTALDYLLLGQGLVKDASLAPLIALPQLRELHLCALSAYRDIDCVAELPALHTLEIVNVESSADRADWEAVIAALRSRGVTVPRNP
jgi:hypothetical protein